MFDPLSVYSFYTAFIAGLVTSIHCVAMCGPLACAFAGRTGTMDATGVKPVSTAVLLSAYHGAKLTAYGIIGFMAGALGGGFLRSFEGSSLRWFGWLLVAFFLVVALRLDRLVPRSRWLGKKYGRVAAWARSLPRAKAAALMGAASPLLPCGPLYLIFGLALFSGSGLQGVEFALGFGLGTIPLLWFAQSRLMRLHGGVSRRWLPVVQRWLALLAALVVAWRLRGTLGFETDTFFCF